MISTLELSLTASKTDGSEERELYAKFKCYVNKNTDEERPIVEEQADDVVQLALAPQNEDCWQCQCAMLQQEKADTQLQNLLP